MLENETVGALLHLQAADIHLWPLSQTTIRKERTEIRQPLLTD